MNQLALPQPSRSHLPALVAAADDRARPRFLEFFAANIRPQPCAIDGPPTTELYDRTKDWLAHDEETMTLRAIVAL